MSVVTNDTFQYNLQLVKEIINDTGKIVVDVETNGLNSDINQLCGIGVGNSIYNGKSFYFPFRHHQGENLSYDLMPILMKVLNDTKTIIGYNIKFDLRFLENDGFIVDYKELIDVIVMVRLSEHSNIRDFGLTPTGSRWYGKQSVQYDIDTKKALKSYKWFKDFSVSPPTFLGEYCKKDVELTARVYEDAEKYIIKTQQSQVFNLQCELTRVLYKVENRGITIDQDYAIKCKKLIDAKLLELQAEIYGIANQEFDILSTQQLGKVFESLNIESTVKTEKGNSSWNEAALMTIDHRLAGLIRQYRGFSKLNSTYIAPYIDTTLMRTNFCNWGTSTGRLSSREPNLQNIPRNSFRLSSDNITEKEREDIKNRMSAAITSKGQNISNNVSNELIDSWSFVGDEYFDEKDTNQISIRRLFIPKPEHTLVSFDYSQMEVRVFMSYFRNDVIDELLYKSDVDFHGEAAKLAFGVNEKDVQFKYYRQLAKGITFGTIYGMGAKNLAQQLSTTVQEATVYKNKYFDGLKGSKNFFNNVTKAVTERGWVKNRYGRRYQIDKDFAYKGVNYLVQGTSADLLSERMIEVEKRLSSTKSSILLQVHDEIICEIHNSEMETLPMVIKDILQDNSLDIPLEVDVEICSPSWATKKDLQLT
tara:strand:- start:744 stop:2681 length:1938 start_codon:yes stop_codon:yes gene_type:complete